MYKLPSFPVQPCSHPTTLLDTWSFTYCQRPSVPRITSESDQRTGTGGDSRMNVIAWWRYISKYITVVNLKICACRVSIQTYHIYLFVRIYDSYYVGHPRNKSVKKPGPPFNPDFMEMVYICEGCSRDPVSRWFWGLVKQGLLGSREYEDEPHDMGGTGVSKRWFVFIVLDQGNVHFWDAKKTKQFPAKTSFQRGKFGSVTLSMWSNFWISRIIHVQKRVFKGVVLIIKNWIAYHWPVTTPCRIEDTPWVGKWSSLVGWGMK